MSRLLGKTALITGAGSGIGLATARLFAHEGARLLLLGRREKPLWDLAQELGAKHPQSSFWVRTCDLTQPAQVEGLFTWFRSQSRQLDILINNAGCYEAAPVEALSLEHWHRLLAVNLTGPFLTSRLAFAWMKELGKGSLVNVISLAGVQGAEKFAGTAGYTASKMGLTGLTQVLAVEGRPHGIRVNGLAPGAVETGMLSKANPQLKAGATPAEIAQSLLYLADDQASPAVTGSILEIWCNA